VRKGYWACYALSFCLLLSGIIFRDRLILLDKVFVLLGAGLFLLVFVRHCVSRAPRCPNCNAVIFSGHIRTIARQKDGRVPCEKCGSLVRVKHSR